MERDKPNNKRSLQIDLAPYGIPPLNIVDMTAAIHSDPSSGSILVDDLEHTGRRSVGNLYGQNFLRGGILWYGYGCISSAVGGKDCDGFTGDPGFYRLRLYGGPTLKPGSGNIPHSTYSNGGYEIFSPTGTTTRVDVPYFSSTQNRGWVRIEYTGTKSSVAVPYAVKSKAMDIGTWNMTVEPYMKELRFSDLGIAANRVTRLATVIRSDHFTNCLSRCFPGHEYKNFHAPLTSGRPSEKNLGFGGGNTFIDESKNYSDGSKGIIGLYLSSQDSKFSDPNGVYTGSGNRGSVLVDYLAGSCENGISGFNIQAIPGTYIGACGTTATTFDFEGSGSDVWNSADDFTYMSKIGSNDKDLVIRVDAQNAGDGWARTGIMIRESQAPGARHASIFVTPSNGIRFTYRNYNNQPTTHSGANSLKAPYFLRLQKSGTTFTASVRPNTSSSWTTIGTKPISGFPSTNYYYGLAQTSKKTTLAKSTFSNRSGF